jgi:hypothetical protein
MPYVTIEDETSGPIYRYFEDHGAEAPGVLTNDHPLSGGFGESGQPSSGDEDDTFAAYLDVLLRV